MFRSPVGLVLALGTLALAGCGEDRTPTQPESSAQPGPAAPLAQALTPNTWTLKAAPPNYLFVNQLSAGVVPDASGQSVVYILGGRDEDGGSGASVATYRIGTNTWSVKSYEPRVYVFNSNGVGRIGNTLYISGGESYSGGSWFVDGSFSAYDPATNTLTQKPNPPKSTADGITGVIDGKLFVLPGICSTYFTGPTQCDHEAFRRLFRYNPATNLWATKKSSPHFHSYGAGGVIGGKFYVAGGEDTLGLVAALDRYDPATDTWKTLAPLPVAGHARGAVILGKLFVVITIKSEFWAYSYDPATNTWTRKAAPKWDHPEIVPITWGGKPFLLAVGGIHWDPGALPNPTEVYAP
jgi:N-acetylneuraminic acid mutarotase